MGRSLTERLHRRGPMSHLRSRKPNASSTRDDSAPLTCTAISARYIACSPNRHGSHLRAPGSARRIDTGWSPPPAIRNSLFSRSGAPGPDTAETTNSTSPSICRPSRLRSRASTSSLPSPASKLGLRRSQSMTIGPTYSSSTGRHRPSGTSHRYGSPRLMYADAG